MFTNNVGVRIAQQLTAALAGSVALPHKEIEHLVYKEFNRLAESAYLGDWIELPNGTTYTCTFKPRRQEG